MRPASQYNNKYPEIVRQSDAASRQSCSKTLLEDILNTYRTALQRIASGVSSCIDGAISLDREDMQAIARTATDKVAGLEFDEDQKQSNASLEPLERKES